MFWPLKKPLPFYMNISENPCCLHPMFAAANSPAKEELRIVARYQPMQVQRQVVGNGKPQAVGNGKPLHTFKFNLNHC